MALKFGEAVLELGLITSEQLAVALEHQKLGKFPLGQILVHNKMLTPAQVEEILAEQRSRDGQIAFGDLAIQMGLITSAMRDEAVGYQKGSQGILGDLLVKLGFLSDDQRNQVIRYQLI